MEDLNISVKWSHFHFNYQIETDHFYERIDHLDEKNNYVKSSEILSMEEVNVVSSTFERTFKHLLQHMTRSSV